MTLLTEPTRIVLAKTPQPLDADAQAYVNAVEVADRQRIEDPVRFAINDFVIGCKADGIWTAIKASCILAGARTRLGALTPLVGTAPTSFNFVDGDYNRKTGLVGDGSTKYLDSNRAGNADPQDNRHLSVYASSLPTGASRVLAGQARNVINGVHFIYNDVTRFGGSTSNNYTAAAGFIGVSRSESANYARRNNLVTDSVSQNSATPIAAIYYLYRDYLSVPIYSNARIAFYSIGESLNLELLDTRVTTLINAFAAAIP